MSRFFGRFFRLIDHSWQMYPLGVLFGLGFDTASEVGLLALAARRRHARRCPFLAILSLPMLFAAGMCLMDTLDGVFMSQAYGWAFSNPIRKIYYNMTVTTLSVVVALAIGTVELLQVASIEARAVGRRLGRGSNALDFGTLGYVIVALFVRHVGDLGRGLEDPPDRGPLGRDGGRGPRRALIRLRRRRAQALRAEPPGPRPHPRGGCG